LALVLAPAVLAGCGGSALAAGVPNPLAGTPTPLSGNAAALAPSSSSPPAAGAAPPSAAFRTVPGVNGYTVFKLSPVQRNQQLAAMEVAGVRVVRSDVPWAQVEPVPPGPAGHVWEFSGFDSWVSALATDHLTWQPLVDFSVWWAKTCPGFCAPTSDSTYAAFAQAVAARYGAGGSFWSQNPQLPYYPAQVFEIWNEENAQTFWVPPARFASLYSAARDAIHSVDRSASVIVGGLSDDSQAFNASQDYPAWYVSTMFAAQPSLKGNVDGFGLHPYGTTAADDIQWTVHFRHVLDSLGEGSAPIDITEFGWLTGDSTRETWRAWQMNTMAFQLSRSDCGIRLLTPYDWINPGAATSTDFGLVDSSGLDTTLRLAGKTWFYALGQAASMGQLSLCEPQPTKPTGPTPTKPTAPTPTRHAKPKHKKPARHKHKKRPSRRSHR
jgi:hypothetical protein